MKKHAALLLALLLALSLAAPALAYTDNTASKEQEKSPYTVDLYLVEYNDGNDRLSNWLSNPPASRGYTRNEVIAAIGTLTVPAEHNVYADYYSALIFSGKNVSLNIVENKPSITGQWIFAALTTNITDTASSFTTDSWRFDGDYELVYYIDAEEKAVYDSRVKGLGSGLMGGDNNRGKWAIPVAPAKKTYRFLVFGKVTDNDASLTFSLSRNTFFDNAEWFRQPNQLPLQNNFWINYGQYITPIHSPSTVYTVGMTLSEELLVISWEGASISNFTHFPRKQLAGPDVYYVMENSLQSLNFAWGPSLGPDVPGELLLAIVTGDEGKTEQLYVYPNGTGPGRTEYRVHVEPSTQELIFIITKYPPAGKAEGDQIKFGTAGYNALLAFYNEWFEEKLGFTAYNEGNFLSWDDWHALGDATIDISATVELKPWAPYVSVPDNIVSR